VPHLFARRGKGVAVSAHLFRRDEAGRNQAVHLPDRQQGKVGAHCAGTGDAEQVSKGHSAMVNHEAEDTIDQTIKRYSAHDSRSHLFVNESDAREGKAITPRTQHASLKIIIGHQPISQSSHFLSKSHPDQA
jgi:hypothetical protein